MTDASVRKPSIVAVVLAALPPLLFPAMAFMLLVILVQGTPVDSITDVIRNAGSWGYVVLGGTVLAALLCVVLLVLAGLGRRVPAAAMIGAAALPWVLGVVGMADGMRVAERTVEAADRSTMATLMSVGVAEAMCARTLGATLGGALLAAVAVALGIVAIGQRAPKRRFVLGGLLGLATGLAWLGAIGIAMKTRSGSEFTDLALLVALPAAAGLFACLLAGAGAGADEPNGRSSALSAAAPIAAMLACVAGAAAVISIGATGMLSSLGHSESTDSMSRAMTIVYGIDRMFRAELVTELALMLGLVPVVALAAWAYSRRRPSRGHVIGGLALLSVAGAVLLFDYSTFGHAEDLVAQKNLTPGSEIEGFSPVTIPEGDSEPVRGAVVVASSQGVSFAREAPMPWSVVSSDAGRARLATRFHAPRASIALDRRLTGAQVRALLRAVAHAGIVRVSVVGPGEDMAYGDVSPEDLGRALPLVAAVSGAPMHRSILLESSVPATAAEADRTLIHATIRGPSAPRLETRTGQTYEPVEPAQNCFPEHFGDRPSGPVVHAWVAFADGASAADIVHGFARFERGSGVRALLVIGDTIPGHPERPYVAPPPDPSAPPAAGTTDADRIRAILERQ